MQCIALLLAASSWSAGELPLKPTCQVRAISPHVLGHSLQADSLDAKAALQAESKIAGAS